MDSAPHVVERGQATLPVEVGTSSINYFPYAEADESLHVVIETTTSGELVEWGDIEWRYDVADEVIVETSPDPDAPVHEYYFRGSEFFDITESEKQGVLIGHRRKPDVLDFPSARIGSPWKQAAPDDNAPVTRVIQRAQEILPPYNNIFFMPRKRENPFLKARRVVAEMGSTPQEKTRSAAQAVVKPAFQAETLYDGSPQPTKLKNTTRYVTGLCARVSMGIENMLTKPEYKQRRRLSASGLLGSAALATAVAGTMYLAAKGNGDAAQHLSNAAGAISHGAAHTATGHHHPTTFYTPKHAVHEQALPKGMNPWTLARKLLNLSGIHRPSTEQIVRVDNDILRLNHLNQAKARHIKADTELKVPILSHLDSIRSTGSRILRFAIT